MRKLATIETILSVTPIEGADRIEAIGVRGWTCVSGKGNFKVGDRCVYFEVDSALPLSMPRFAFLADHAKTYNGKQVHVLKTKRLRGVYSQGLCLPLRDFPSLEPLNLQDGEDVSAILMVELYEPPVSATMGNMQPAGNFPTQYVMKTDAERCQNLTGVWDKLRAFGNWQWSEKLDGTSMTVVRTTEGLTVCSRNLALKESDNIYWRMVRQYKLDELLTEVGDHVQGEIVGPGVQGNPLALKENKFYIFGWRFSSTSVDMNIDHLDFVPVPTGLAAAKELFAYCGDEPDGWANLPETAQELLMLVDGMKSALNPQKLAEGVVLRNPEASKLHALGGRCVFKAISNRFLEKQG